MQEIWKEVKGYEGLYEVSNLGNVKSIFYSKNKILKSALGSKGYKGVVLFKNKKGKTYEIHKLMAIVFLNHTPNGHNIIVDHIDNNPLNNSLENLQLITHRENISKDYKSKTSKYTGVCFHLNKWQASIRINGKLKYLGRFETEIEAHNKYQNELIKLNYENI